MDPTPMMSCEYATWNCTAIYAPADTPDTDTLPGAMLYTPGRNRIVREDETLV